MANLVKYQPMSVVETKDGQKYYILASDMEKIVSKSSGFVPLGGGFVNVFEIKSVMPVEMTDVEQAIWGYPKEKRDKIMRHRNDKLLGVLGRDFKDTAEVHRYADSISA
jgi:hypothetical protein